MQYTNIEAIIQKYLIELKQHYPLLASILKSFDKAGGTPYLVGGAVRDLMLNKKSNDIDIEAHHISLEVLENILSSFGPISLVGRSFGVVRLHSLDIDWSIPRQDSAGRHPKVIFDSSMDIKQAFERRDLTINAMGINLLTSELVDPFNGLKDLKAKRLRTPNAERFIEDPLRFFRVMQTIARFEMYPDDELQILCKTMDINGVAKERIAAEFEKAMLHAQKPSLAFEWLNEINRLSEILPELAATKGVPQEPQWHPEGDVWEHTKQALDAAAQLPYESTHEKLCLLWATLCHDLGKVSTTRFFDNAYRAHGHDKEGAAITSKMLPRIVMNDKVISTAILLVRYHMQPGNLVKTNAKLPAYKRLASKLAPYATLEMLGKLYLADKRGTNPKKGEPLNTIPEKLLIFVHKAQEAGVLYHQEKPILVGRDLLDVIKPGPEIGALLKQAYKLQIEKGITNKNKLKRLILNRFSS